MAAQTMFVTLSLEDTLNLIYQAVVGGSVTGELIDSYRVDSADQKTCIINTYEKHYWRTGNRLTLTVMVDNMGGYTRVHTVSGGGGALIKFDWGASESFTNIVPKTLAPYLMR